MLTEPLMSYLRQIFLLLVMLSYSWFVAREALQTSGALAASIVAIDFSMAVFIEYWLGLR